MCLTYLCMENLQPVIEELSKRATTAENEKLKKWLNCSIKVLKVLDDKGVDPKAMDKELKVLRKQLDADTRYEQIRSFYGMLTVFAKKEYNLLPPRYYQNQWMAIGMTAFGLPFGLMFALTLDNMAFLGIGLPIGMSLGIAIGAEKDKKAKAQGLQL